jgi:hypothetical protein
MTTEEFNALPLEARQYIINQQGCASCGKTQDLSTLYKKFLIMQKQKFFTLRIGAVSYKTEDGQGAVLYPLHPKDSESTILEKLKTALKVHEVAPTRFSEFNKRDIEGYIEAQGVEDLGAEDLGAEDLGAEDLGAEDKTPETKPLFGAAKKAAEAKAAKVANDLD